MVQKFDDTTLEAIAELICGAGDGSGGGYGSPGPYRTKGQVVEFFARAGVIPRGESSTRKWFALESLQAVNGQDAFERVLLRLASPKEYRADDSVTQSVIDHLNKITRIEGFEIVLLGVEPQLRKCNPAMYASPVVGVATQPSPNFHRLVQDTSLAEVLSLRWQESQRCVQGQAHLAAVVMMGSILEGVLLHKLEENREVGNRARSAPKDKSGKPKPIQDWGLSALIDVAHEVGWLQGDVKRFSHALRDSRNLVHPYMQRLHGDMPDEDTCSICWQVVRAAVSDLLMTE